MLLTRRAWTELGIAAALAAGVAIWRGGAGGDGTGPEEPAPNPPAAPASPAAMPPAAPATPPSPPSAPPAPTAAAPPVAVAKPAPPPPEPDTEEEKAFREQLRAIKTGFKFEGGLDLATVLTYLAARHEVKIVVDRSAADACAKAHPSLTMENAPLADALDKLIASAPGLAWDVDGKTVRVTKP